MVPETDKYRANIIQISGFALMAPFGNLILNIFGVDLFKFGIILLLFYVLVSLVLFYYGVICLLRSFEIIKEKEK